VPFRALGAAADGTGLVANAGLPDNDELPAAVSFAFGTAALGEQAVIARAAAATIAIRLTRPRVFISCIVASLLLNGEAHGMDAGEGRHGG
jgi:hypothetical protein